MKLSSLKEHGIAIALFVILTCLFCYPIFQGKVLQSHDNLSWQYMSQESKAWYETHGGPIYWSNSMFGGMPTYTTYGGNGYGNYIATFLFKSIDVFPRPFGLLLLCFVTFYVLGTSLGWKFWARILGAIAFTFSSYNPILAGAGHDTKIMTIAFAVAAVGGMINIINNRTWPGIAILTLSLCFMFSSMHLQIIYYMILLMAIFAITLLIKSIKENKVMPLLKQGGIILGCTILALLPTLSTNLLTKEYSKSTIRGGQSELTARKGTAKPNGGLDKDYAFSWSNGVGETFSLLIPRLYGGGSSEELQGGAAYEYVQSRAGDEQAESFSKQLPLYWGPQPFLSGPIYFGAIIVFLFIFSFFVIRSPHKWWIAIASLFFILLSLGKNFSSFNYFLFDHLPMYNKFRTPSMALSIPMFLFPMLGVWALNDLFSEKIDKVSAMKYLKISTAITAGLAFIVGVGASLFFSFKGQGDGQLLEQLGGSQAQPLLDAIISDRASVAMRDGIRSVIFILIAAGTIMAFLLDKIKSQVAILILIFATFFDLYTVSQRYLNPSNPNVYEETEIAAQNFSPRAVDAQILEDKDPYYRVQDFTVNTYNDAKPSYYHKMVGGYHPAKIEMYQDLIEMQMSPGTPHNNKEVYNMLNTKYFILPAGQGQAQVVPNTEACGNAWFVNSIQFAATADLEMKALNAPNLFDTTKVDGDFKPKEIAIVRENFKSLVSKTSFNKDSNATIKLAEYGLNKISFESNNANDGFGVFSDIYYDGGWVAKIDGKETPIIRTDYVLRGLLIPSGKHKIEFEIKPTILKTSEPVSIIGCVLVLLVFGFGLYKSIDDKKSNA